MQPIKEKFDNQSVTSLPAGSGCSFMIQSVSVYVTGDNIRFYNYQAVKIPSLTFAERFIRTGSEKTHKVDTGNHTINKAKQQECLNKLYRKQKFFQIRILIFVNDYLSR